MLSILGSGFNNLPTTLALVMNSNLLFSHFFPNKFKFWCKWFLAVSFQFSFSSLCFNLILQPDTSRCLLLQSVEHLKHIQILWPHQHIDFAQNTLLFLDSVSMFYVINNIVRGWWFLSFAFIDICIKEKINCLKKSLKKLNPRFWG